MSTQIPSLASNKRISELYTRIKNQSLILQPEFQRKLVWTVNHKENFIDTILKGLPFPEIYIAQSGINLDTIETQEVVVDGQQRLSTIVEYIDDINPSTFGKKVRKYNQLSKEEKSNFLSYTVVTRDLGDISPTLIKEIFSRINQTKFNLQPVEIQNAIYDGEFITTAKEILSTLEQDHLPIFSESQLSRMSDLHFILLIMSTIELSGYFADDREIETQIIKYNELYESKVERKDQIVTILRLIKSFEFSLDTIWYSKSNFFTLVIELTKIGKEYDKSLKERLIDFEVNVLQNKNLTITENDFAEYYSYMYTGTNSRKARVTRAKIFRKHVLGKVETEIV